MWSTSRQIAISSLRPSLKASSNFSISLPRSRWRLPLALRQYSSSEQLPTQTLKPPPHKPAPHRNPDEPIYQLTFTCKPCQQRTSHTISKQGFHNGTVLITCPGCKNRHLISDHLKIFSDTRITIEDIMKTRGEAVQRGIISPDGDVEFWPSQDVNTSEDDARSDRP